MKKIAFILLLIPFIGEAQQNLDTVYIRNLTQKAEYWWYHRGTYGTPKDSTELHHLQRIDAACLGLGPNASVTIDSIPGRMVVTFYNNVLSEEAGALIGNITAMRTPFDNKPQIAAILNNREANKISKYVQAVIHGRQLGKRPSQ